MKFTAALLLVLPLAVSASPLETRFAELLFSRQSAASETDRLLFSVTLSAFLQARAAQNPSYLDWSSDSCSSSPDNPFGFPFDPACQRHDFGYRNYKAQNRFTDAGKLRIDNNFRNECVLLFSVYPFSIDLTPLLKYIGTFSSLTSNRLLSLSRLANHHLTPTAYTTSAPAPAPSAPAKPPQTSTTGLSAPLAAARPPRPLTVSSRLLVSPTRMPWPSTRRRWPSCGSYRRNRSKSSSRARQRLQGRDRCLL